MVDHAGLTLRLAERLADFAAALAVLNPELSVGFVGGRQREAVRRVGMREISRIEVQRQLVFAGEVHPVGELLGGVRVAVDLLAVQLGVAGVQVQLFLSGNHRNGLQEILAQLFAVARAARIVAGGLNAAGRAAAFALAAHNVVALPAVHGDGELRRLLHRLFHVDALFGIYVLRVVKTGQNHFFGHMMCSSVLIFGQYYSIASRGLCKAAGPTIFRNLMRYFFKFLRKNSCHGAKVMI